jgi:hypothetical protein
MGVAEIEYTWDYVSIPSKLSFFWGTLANTMVTNTLSPGKTKERTALFSLCLRTVRAASFQRWGTHAATETGIKSQNASPECSIWNSKRCYMGVQTPKMSISHIYIYILHSYYWSISVSLLNITTKQDVQHAPQAKDVWNVHQVLQTTNSPATHTVFFPCRSNSYGTNALTKSSGIRQIWWTIHIKNTPARDLQQCGG